MRDDRAFKAENRQVRPNGGGRLMFTYPLESTHRIALFWGGGATDEREGGGEVVSQSADFGPLEVQ